MAGESAQQPEWSFIKLWQVMDPAIDWRSILTQEQIRQIAVVQLEQQMRGLEMQMAYLKQVHDIVAAKK